jgi:2-polyprenyl-3-methyl-5-hydroxy-6-metoxy-1,4-benzoquinol methylase
MGSKGFSERDYAIEFGRYEGIRRVEPPAHELLIAREGQRAHFLNLLFTVGRKGAYLVTGHRGSGKTTFVNFCLDEYQENVYRRYLASNIGRTFLWDRIGLLAIGVLAILAALVLTEASQQIAVLKEVSLLDWITLVPLLLLCCYPILVAKELSEFVFRDVRGSRLMTRWAAGLRPDGPGYLGVSLLALVLACSCPLGKAALAVSQLVLLAGWLFLVTNLFAVSAWPSPVEPGLEDPSLDLAPMEHWQKVPARLALLAGIASVFWWPAEAARGWVVQNWFFGFALVSCGAFWRYRDQVLRSRQLHQEHGGRPDGKSSCDDAVCGALSGAAKWYLFGAIFAISLSAIGTALNWGVFGGPATKRFGWAFLMSTGLACVGGWLWRKYQRRPPPDSRSLSQGGAEPKASCEPFRFHPASRVLLAFKALAFLALGLQLAYPVALLVRPQVAHWLASAEAPWRNWLQWASARLPLHPDSLMALSSGEGVLFAKKSDEILWVVGVLLLLVFFVFVEYEWIIRPYSALRDDEALHVRERRERGDDRPSLRASSLDRLDYHKMAAKTFFWATFTAWLPVLRVNVNLGSDILEYRYVIEGMLAGLKHEYHRTFLHWSSKRVAIRRGLTIVILGLLALFAGQRWFGIVDSTADPAIQQRTFCKSAVRQATILDWLACQTGGERLLQFLQWAPLARGPSHASSVPTATTRALLVDRVVAVRDGQAPRLRELRIYHLLVLLVFYGAYARLWRAIHFSPYRQTYNKISRLLDSLSSRLREESRPDRSKLTEWLLAMVGSEKVEAKEFAPFDPRTVELTFLQILVDSQDPKVLLPFTHRGRISPPVPEIVFIFDELDKIGGLAAAAVPQPQRAKEDDEGTAEREPHDVERERARALHRLFSDLKTILSSGPARFIFLGGRNLHDEWLADQSARRPLLTNTFDAEIHLPSLLTEEIAGRPAGTALEGVRRFVDEHRHRAAELYRRSQVKTLGPWLRLWREERQPVSFIQGPRREYRPGAGNLPLRDEQGEPKAWSADFTNAFIEFLGYRSRGNVKKLREVLEGFIRPVRRVIVEPKLHARFNCEHVLLFHDTDRFRIQLVADIYRQVGPILEARLCNRDDKLSHNVLYLSDYLLKFHRRAFTWSNLGRVDELVHIHRAPDLRPMLEDMVLNWSEGYLHLINNGMYDYRFESHFARELEYLSRQSEQELAALNFTLDESQQLKSRYNARLAALKEPSALDFIIGLGELHEFDEEFELARYHYRWAVRKLDEEFRFQAMAQSDQSISFAVLAETKSGYEAARRIAVWGIARVRLMLQIAMTYERARDLEHAQVEYRDARTLASAIIRGLLGWKEGQLAIANGLRDHLEARQSSAKGYLWALKHLNILFQPLFAEAWLAEKSVGGVDTGPSLLERELWELRRIFPFEGAEEFSQPGLPKSRVEVQHSNFSLIFAELHDKAGSLYFFKGRQLAPADISIAAALQGTEGYLLIAQSHYATSLHEIRRFNFYRRHSSKIKFNDIQGVAWETIREGGWAEFVYRIGAGALCNLGEALLGRVSLRRLLAGQADLGQETLTDVASALDAVYRAIGAWLEWSKPPRTGWSQLLRRLFPSCTKTQAKLWEWFGKQPAAAERFEGQLLRFPRIHGDDERLATSLLFSLAGAHLLEEAGYFEGAAEECLKVVRTAAIYIWWIRMVQVLCPLEFKGPEAQQWQQSFLATSAGKGSLPAVASDLISLAVERLEHVENLYLRSRRARVLADQQAHLRPATLLTYACALGLGVLQIAPHLQKHLERLRRLVGRCSRPMVWVGPVDERTWFRERLRDGLDQHSFPMFNRLVGLKVLIDDTLLAEATPGTAEREEVATYIDELVRFERLYKSPLHFIPLHSGLTLGLACLRWRERVAVTVELRPAFIHETAKQQLATSQQMVTLKRSYYETISGLYYLYDDFNDRTIHFNHAVQMSGMELASFVLALLDSFELPPDAPMKPWMALDSGEDRLFARHEREWEEMAAVNPYFASLNHGAGRDWRWEVNREEFFGTGRAWVSTCMERLENLNWRPHQGDRVLDFGCGVGRLTEPLAVHFESVVGVDCSQVMIVRACGTHWHRPEVAFHLHKNLAPLVFKDREFDLAVCVNVLEHQADERSVERWLSEMIRVLKPGGALVFQLPCVTPRPQRLQWRLYGYRWLRARGVPPGFLIRRGLAPISVLAIPEGRLRRIVEEAGGEVLAVDRDDGCSRGCPSATYYVSRPDA